MNGRLRKSTALTRAYKKDPQTDELHDHRTTNAQPTRPYVMSRLLCNSQRRTHIHQPINAARSPLDILISSRWFELSIQRITDVSHVLDVPKHAVAALIRAFIELSLHRGPRHSQLRQPLWRA